MGSAVFLALGSIEVLLLLRSVRDQGRLAARPLPKRKNRSHPPCTGAASPPTRLGRGQRNEAAASSKSEYATGVISSVNSSESIWPPITTTAIARRSSAP